MNLESNIPLFRIHWFQKDLDMINDVIKRGSYWATGKEIRMFEEEIAKYVHSRYCLVVNSGTSALHLALVSLGIGQGDEVIVPSFSFIATSNAVLFVGAKPVFADIEEKTFGLDPKDVERKINDRTKAIILMHYGGVPCYYTSDILKIARKKGLYLIEDACEGLGAKVNSKMVGTIGDIGVYSFCQNKIITTGEGGAIVIKDKYLFDKLKLLRSHGRNERTDYFSGGGVDYVQLGFNFRMATMNAALGLSQLENIDELIQLRNKSGMYLDKLLRGLPVTFLTHRKQDEIVYLFYTIRLMDEKIRDRLSIYLKDRGISNTVYFKPIHLTHFYRQMYGFKSNMLPMTERISKECLTLPMFPGITKEELDYIAKCLYDFFDLQMG